ncbi:sensor histidine kinase [Noviherbaspirillum sp. ST9]|uniref:sensor histidine kinase n=1 Tax=Noviherbaspirillum sp. ST9 TaxID=3401606 RepID=UPI003B589EAF
MNNQSESNGRLPPAPILAARGPVSDPARSNMLAQRVDARMLVFMRCVLAFSAFLVVNVDPAEPRHLVELSLISLAVYCVYSVVLTMSAMREGWPQPSRKQHWVDLFFYVYLAAVTDGTNSIFFNFFLFSILAAAFTRGFREGLRVSLATLLAFLLLGLVMAQADSDFELNRTLLRTVYLFVFGYMISYWGGYENLLKKRLTLLSEINNAWNPRFGVDHAIGSNLDRLLQFYKAESCVLLLRHSTREQGNVMYRRLRDVPAVSEAPLPMPDKASEPMLRLPPTLGAFFHTRTSGFLLGWRGYAAWDLVSKQRSRDHLADCQALANLLDTNTFVTVPYVQRDGTSGRLFLSGARRGFDYSDITFLTQTSAALATVVENISLMDELITRASEQEREKISRDLHDSTVQPYIGLKLALDALLREAGQDNRISKRLSELVDMAGMTIRDLRAYAAVTGKPSMPGDFLLDAIRTKAERLKRFYGIEVKLDTVMSHQLDGKIAAEVFHIVSEGMSNILRHTTAKQAYVHMVCEGKLLTIDIGNEAKDMPAAFMPRSIRERAEASGGSTLVERDADGYTVVRIVIPL